MLASRVQDRHRASRVQDRQRAVRDEERTCQELHEQAAAADLAVEADRAVEAAVEADRAVEAAVEAEEEEACDKQPPLVASEPAFTKAADIDAAVAALDPLIERLERNTPQIAGEMASLREGKQVVTVARDTGRVNTGDASRKRDKEAQSVEGLGDEERARAVCRERAVCITPQSILGMKREAVALKRAGEMKGAKAKMQEIKAAELWLRQTQQQQVATAQNIVSSDG